MQTTYPAVSDGRHTDVTDGMSCSRSVLMVSDKKGRALGTVSAEEHEALLAAFARLSATADERQRGAAVVRRYQLQRHWFRCGCLGPGQAMPVLTPVAGTYIRREPDYPDHADGCPFETDVKDRTRHAKHLREPEPAGGFRLVRAIANAGAAQEQPTGEGGPSRGPGKAHHRTKLGQLLFKLLSDARVHRIGVGPRGREAQVQALHAAARGISLGGALRLSCVLETDLGRIDRLLGRMNARAQWPKGRRPHGVLVFIAVRIEGEVIVAVSGARITVVGPIMVYGPGRGRVRHGPFVVAVLVASPDGKVPPAPLEAYAHPCWSEEDMLPVDSTHERRCLGILASFQSWMAGQGCTVEITKPLYDRSKYYTGREEGDAVVKPDFEGAITAAPKTFLRSFVVEVMGYAHPEYRRAKAHLEEIIRRKRVHYIEHLAYDGVTEAEGDLRLRRDLMQLGSWAIEKAKTSGPPVVVPAQKTSPSPLPLSLSPIAPAVFPPVAPLVREQPVRSDSLPPPALVPRGRPETSAILPEPTRPSFMQRILGLLRGWG